MWIRPKDEKGRFIVFSGNQKYKQCQLNGIRKQSHVLIWEDYHGMRVPKGHIIHHINENKLDNRIENLICMTITKHNQKHHKNIVPWNKGKKCNNISNSLIGHIFKDKSKIRQRMTWFNKSLDTNIKIWQMKDKGHNINEICLELNLTKDKVNHMWIKFNDVYLSKFGR